MSSLLKTFLVQTVHSLNAAFVISNETSVCETACIDLTCIVLSECEVLTTVSMNIAVF